MTNQVASVTPASANSVAPANTPTQTAPVFSKDASPSVNDALEAKFADGAAVTGNPD